MPKVKHLVSFELFKIITNLLMMMKMIVPTVEFNLSPKPNYMFKDPNLKTNMPKYRSSYFGFSIVLRENSFIVGAPRAQSTLELQRKINETGAIYKCSLVTQKCIPYVFDSQGNVLAENNEYTYDSEKKDYQWLGAAIDGGPKETDRLVVCAPRLISNLEPEYEYMMHGVCFWTPDTIGEKPQRVKKISPLRLKVDQVKEINGIRYFYYIFGEQGISVHITENNEEILIGSPGINTWKGSIIRYKAKIKEDVGGLSRRDSEPNRLMKRENLEFVSEIPRPESWEQENDSYFGYSVTSGFFELQFNKKQILYIASAPQAKQQSGEVYLFDMIKTPNGHHSIKKYYTFHGSQFGEYFGYTVTTEDINGDELTDVIISAPFYSAGDVYDQGAIYVFMNKGKVSFDQPKIITVKSDLPSRFGTSVTKLGDINNDGYNDIGIGAPFDKNGYVYIFLGSSKGLNEKPSQILKFPSFFNGSNAMFGHSLSKGVDIDRNGFNDLAIGAPNAEIVYIYKSYPVVSIIAYVRALSREIKIDQSKFQFNACYQLESSTPNINYQEIIIKLKVDPVQKRMFFPDGTTEMVFTVMGKETMECRLFDVTVQYNPVTIFKPIEIEMHYKLKTEILNNNNTLEIVDFCTTCTVVDPSSPTVSVEKISFSTGCKGECVADLKIKSSDTISSFVIGSSDVISVEYEITNNGENAYLPQLNVTSSNNMLFARTPSNCEQNNYIMICDLFKKQPMKSGDKDFITILFQASNIEGDKIIIQAEVSSTGKEENSYDNIVEDIIQLREFSEVEISGRPFPSAISLDDGLGQVEMSNKYEIRNFGPSRIKEMNLTVFIPTSYQLPKTNNRIPIVDSSNISVTVVHNEQILRTDFYQKDIILLPNPVIISTPTPVIENYQANEFHMSHMGYEWNTHENEGDMDSSQLMTRKKRETSKLNVDLMGSFPVNKTILFNCESDTEGAFCIKGVTNILDFQANDIITISVNFTTDLTEINKILTEPLEFFVITTDLKLVKSKLEESDKELKITKTIAHNIISKHQIYSTPIWIYIISILGGILLLALITYALYKYGFFRREKKEELQKLYRESQIQSVDDTEDEE